MNQPQRTRVSEISGNGNTTPAKHIVDTMVSADHLTAFSACIKSAGLTDALAAKGPFTVFAPTDAAFQKLAPGAYEVLLKDSAKLKAILNYHVIPGHFMSRDVKSGEVMTLQGSTLTVAISSQDVRVNGARITQADIAATNGIVHVIDAVILPKNWQLLAAAA